MPTIYKRECKTCDRYYESPNKLYCSRTCCFNDKEWLERSVKARAVGLSKSEKTKIHLQKLADKRRGTKFSEEVKAKIRDKAIGRKHTEETRLKLSEINKKRWADGLVTIADIQAWMEAGVNATRGKHNISIAGDKSHFWKGGITALHQQIRTSLEYKLWARAVKERDNFTCIKCQDRSQKGHYVYLHSDHIKPFATYPELRFAIDNGQTLCSKCHAKKTSEDMIVMRRETTKWKNAISIRK